MLAPNSSQQARSNYWNTALSMNIQRFKTTGNPSSLPDEKEQSQQEKNGANAFSTYAFTHGRVSEGAALSFQLLERKF
jgi:hypothetical protein